MQYESIGFVIVVLTLHDLFIVLDGSKDILQEGRSLEQRQEEAFAIHSQERVMGLLGAMIPADSKVCIHICLNLIIIINVSKVLT